MPWVNVFCGWHECFKSWMQKSINDMAQKTDQKPLAILAPLVIIESDAYPESCYTELFPWKPVNFNISFLQIFLVQSFILVSQPYWQPRLRCWFWGLHQELPFRNDALKNTKPSLWFIVHSSARMSLTLSLPTDLKSLFHNPLSEGLPVA